MLRISEKDYIEKMDMAELIVLFRRYPGFFNEKTRNWLSELSAKVEVLKVIHPDLGQASSVEEVLLQTESEIQRNVQHMH